MTDGILRSRPREGKGEVCHVLTALIDLITHPAWLVPRNWALRTNQIGNFWKLRLTALRLASQLRSKAPAAWSLSQLGGGMADFAHEH